MTIGYVVLLGTVTVFGGAALVAFWWALKTGQFDHPDKQATSIFGPDEPVGMATDDVLVSDSAKSRHADRFSQALHNDGGDFRR